jgi:hypothetical protein
MRLNDTDWDWIQPNQAARIEQIQGILGGRPRIANTRVSVAQVLDWVRRLGREQAAKELQNCQSDLHKSEAEASVDAALAFAAAVLDRALPESLTRVRPEWADNVPNWDNTSKLLRSSIKKTNGNTEDALSKAP